MYLWANGPFSPGESWTFFFFEGYFLASISPFLGVKTIKRESNFNCRLTDQIFVFIGTIFTKDGQLVWLEFYKSCMEAGGKYTCNISIYNYAFGCVYIKKGRAVYVFLQYYKDQRQ